MKEFQRREGKDSHGNGKNPKGGKDSQGREGFPREGNEGFPREERIPKGRIP